MFVFIDPQENAALIEIKNIVVLTYGGIFSMGRIFFLVNITCKHFFGGVSALICKYQFPLMGR